MRPMTAGWRATHRCRGSSGACRAARVPREGEGLSGSELRFLVHTADVAAPVAVESVEQDLRGHLSGPDDLAQRIKEPAFIVARGIEPRPRLQPARSDIEHLSGD